jgi:bifunctional non-homologous end joining protein LigD
MEGNLQTMTKINVQGMDVHITNPDKVLWPKYGISKVEYLQKLIILSKYLMNHCENRLITTIRFPDGVNKKSFFQKNIPDYAPEWIETTSENGTEFILLNSLPVLMWLGNQAAIEMHIPFNTVDKKSYPTSLIFDLDPSEGQIFEEVVQVALKIRETMETLGIQTFIKTSGATGLQIYIPIGQKYDYPLARKVNAFFGQYFSEKYPELITIERSVQKRNKKLYFDYLQMWEGKTIIAPYSPRATEEATVATPILWEELEKGIQPKDFNLMNIEKRLEAKGDLFAPLLDPANAQNIDSIIKYVNNKGAVTE